MTTIMSRKVPFPLFYQMWADMNKWKVPDFHYDMMNFFSAYEKWENNTGLIQIFRGAGKSTMVGLFITWMLYRDPTLRFLILSGDKKTAAKITQDIANIVKRHPLARSLHGKENSWRADTLVVNGATDGRNPSVTSWGVLSNITGSRADWVIYDDVEVPNNSRTEEDRQKLRLKLDEPTHILVPGGRELFIGTPHSYDSIYPEVEGMSNKDETFRTGCSSIKIPIMTEVDSNTKFPEIVGLPTWPERFGVDEILRKQLGSSTKGHFMSQYLLEPYNPEETELDPNLIHWYSGDLHVHSANGDVSAYIRTNEQDLGIRMAGVSAVWDPAMSASGRDDSVIAIVFTSPSGDYYIHRTVKVLGDRNAEAQIEHVFKILQESFVNHVHIESNGIGGFLPALFRQKAMGKGITCSPLIQSKKKEERIMEAYEVPLAARKVYAHESVKKSLFFAQLRDFSATGTKGKDDFIDVTATAMKVQPIRIRGGWAGNHFTTWNQGAGSGEVTVDGVDF